MAGISLKFFADVKEFLTGTKQVERALEDTADSLDDLAREATDAGSDAGRGLAKGVDTGTDAAQDSVEKLERSFKDLATSARKSTAGLGDGVADTTRKGMDDAGENVREFKDEARSNLSEVTSSFSGDMTSAVDLVQGTLGGLASGIAGPLGLALGGVAIGVGAMFSQLEKSAEAANDLKQRVLDLAGELSEAGGDLTSIDFTAKMREWGLEVKDVKSAWEFWQKDSTSNFELMEGKARELGLNMVDLFRGMSGSDKAAAVRSLGEINNAIDDQEDVLRRLPPVLNRYDTAAQETQDTELARLNSLKDLKSQLMANAGVTEDAVALEARMATALGEAAAATAAAAQVQEDYAAALDDMADPVGSYEAILTRKQDAERAAAEATAASTADSTDSWEDYAADVAVSIDDLIADLDAQIVAAAAFETNLAIIAAAGGQAVADELRAKGPEVAGATAALIAEAGPEKQAAYIAKYGTATGAATAGAIAAGITAGQPTIAAAVSAFSDHVGSISIPTYLDTTGWASTIEAWRVAYNRKAHPYVTLPAQPQGG